MQTKLTLTIEQSVIERAKQYARSRNRSVSKLVEEYLSNVSGLSSGLTAGIKGTELKLEGAPITKRLTGAFAALDTGQDDQDLLEAALMEKHR
jgi:Family of unknown function (DUF6364)